MLRHTSKDLRAFILLNFTKELIKNTSEGQVLELREVIKEDAKEKKRAVQREKQFAKVRKEFKGVVPGPKRPAIPMPKAKKVLKVPKTKLPSHLQYLKPASPGETELDFGKLDAIIKDPTVNDIECHGPGQNLVIKGTMGTKKANMVLTKEEIDEIIKKFSEAAEVPAKQGLFKVIVGKFIFSAVISEIAGSRFIIKKMTYNPAFR